MALSGITVSDEVKGAFANARTQSSVRWIKLRIEDTKVVLDGDIQSASESLAQDYDLLSKTVKEATPNYFVFRLDTKREGNYEWLLIAYVPDNCKVRERMLYSSTVDGVKRDLGSSNFAGDYHVSTTKELQYSEFNWTHKSQRHIHSKDMYTDEELVRKNVDSEEISGYATGPTKTGVHGVDFAFEDDVSQNIKDLVSGSTQYVSLKIDLETEVVRTANKSEAIEPDQLGATLPADEPRFNFYSFKHEFEGKEQTSVFFIYYCPMKSKVKSRMVYSSSKATLQQRAIDLGVKIEKTLEVSEPNELTSKVLYDWAHPQREDNIKVYSKPKRPGRGNARVTGSTPSTPQDQ
ncbi:hypothetical protein AKO1_012635 [Acrasis kona]|uniref:ADF-H domain-containing protein n=1 Tax=Acrasis kona TaxID=1008807 RepID=A0AAW2YUQ4_9EUKA